MAGVCDVGAGSQKQNQPSTKQDARTKGATNYTTKTHNGSEAGRESQRTNRDEGKTAGGGQQQQDKEAPGKAARTGGRKQHRPRRRAHAALAAS